MQPSILVLVLAPAVLGIGALVAGILLLVRGSDAGDDDASRGSGLALRIVAGFCFLIAFGIGSCYAVMAFG